MIPLPNEKTAQGLTKNILGYSLMGLAASVVTMFVMYTNQNNYIRDKLYDSGAKMETTLRENNTILLDVRNNIYVLKQRRSGEMERVYQVDTDRFLDSVRMANGR